MKKYDYKNFSNFVIPAITYDLIRRLKFINSDIFKGYYIETKKLLKQFNTSKYKIKPKYRMKIFIILHTNSFITKLIRKI